MHEREGGCNKTSKRVVCAGLFPKRNGGLKAFSEVFLKKCLISSQSAFSLLRSWPLQCTTHAFNTYGFPRLSWWKKFVNKYIQTSLECGERNTLSIQTHEGNFQAKILAAEI